MNFPVVALHGATLITNAVSFWAMFVWLEKGALPSASYTPTTLVLTALWVVLNLASAFIALTRECDA